MSCVVVTQNRGWCGTEEGVHYFNCMRYSPRTGQHKTTQHKKNPGGYLSRKSAQIPKMQKAFLSKEWFRVNIQSLQLTRMETTLSFVQLCFGVFSKGETWNIAKVPPADLRFSLNPPANGSLCVYVYFSCRVKIDGKLQSAIPYCSERKCLHTGNRLKMNVSMCSDDTKWHLINSKLIILIFEHIYNVNNSVYFVLVFIFNIVVYVLVWIIYELYIKHTNQWFGSSAVCNICRNSFQSLRSEPYKMRVINC